MAKRTPRTSNGGSGVSNGLPNPPEPRVDAEHDGAPAGKTFSNSELPVVPVHGGSPVRFGKPSYSTSNPSLPMDPHEGATKPPSGKR